MDISGLVFDIQRFSVHDGPGIRSLVFLKGCPLRCPWCCNPESQAFAAELLVDRESCLGCRQCLEACPSAAVTVETDGLGVDRRRCTACGACAERCHSGARRLAGRPMTVPEVLAELLRDAPFFRHSGGGVTLGGGEPLAQPEFAEALLRTCRSHGLHTAVETCGHVPWSVLERIRPWTSLILYDMKHIDPAAYLAGLGGDLGLVLTNLERLAGAGTAVTIRTPLIPGWNDDEEIISAIAARARALGFWEMHLLPFHRLGQTKYDLLGLPHPFREAAPLSEARLRRLRDRAAATGMRVTLGG
jgi:pyruvate formate lyase activating enzyme